MKLHLEVYQEILILQVDQELSARSIEVLLAGFKKLSLMKVQWIFVDLTRAQITPDALIAFESVKDQLNSPEIKKVHLIGKIAKICDFETFEQALQACPVREAQVQRERVVLEKKNAELEEKIRGIEERVSQAGGPKMDQHALNLENRQLKRLKKSMAQAITSYQTEEQYFLNSPPPHVHAEKEWEQLTEEGIQLLKTAGLL